jgi:nitrogen fixation NifU-like protein
MDTPALYRDIVLAHQRAPRRFGSLQQPSHRCDGVNALCGDSLQIEILLRDGRIADYAFRGECCAIAMATASLLGERAIGLDAAALAALQQEFTALVQGESAGLARGDLAALGELARYPARRKCALLPWATLAAALAGHAHTTTEKDAA